MRYSIFLPESKGGYKVGEEDELVAAFCQRQNLNQKYQAACIIYDNELKTTDVKIMIDKYVEEDYNFDM